MKKTGWQTDDDAARYAAEMADVLGLSVEPQYVPAIVQFLHLAAEMADTLDGAHLDPGDAELAPVFRLPDPD